MQKNNEKKNMRSQIQKSSIMKKRSFAFGIALSFLCFFAAYSEQSKAAQSKAAESSSWMATSRVTESTENPGIPLTEIRFSKGSKVLIYTPGEPPFGVVEIKRIRHQERTYFVTTWAHGARSTMIRVFSPETHGSNPICAANSASEQMVTFSENPRTRFRDGALQVLIHDSEGLSTWETCVESPAEPTPEAPAAEPSDSKTPTS